MAAGARRSRADLAVGFARWLGVDTVEVSRPSSGLSSETVFVSTSERTYVVRMPPAGDLSFPDYDLRQQFDVQSALAKAGVPVAEPIAFVDDESFVGSPFLVMPKVEGKLLAMAPPYVQEGWLAESTPQEQARVLGDFLSCLADIHRVPLDAIDVRLSGGGPDLEGAISYWSDYIEWATDDEEAKAVYRDGLTWLRANLPSDVPAPSLLWGDPQLVNMIFDETGQPAAVLDWEMASTGPAEHDLAWFLVLHELAAEVAGGDLPGFPDRRTIIDWYELALGRTTADLHWYELFANIRSGAIVLRIGQLMRNAGGSSSWTAHVPQPRHIKRLIGT